MGGQVTATTIRCDSANEFAVLMVHADGAAKCAWYGKHASLDYLASRSTRYKLERPLAVFLLRLRQLGASSDGSQTFAVPWLPLDKAYLWWRTLYKIPFYLFENMIDREIARRKWRACLGLECPRVKEFRDHALSM